MEQELVERELTEEGLRRSGGAPSRWRRSVTVNLAESPLTWLYACGYLDDRQFAANARFHGALAQAGGGLQDVLWRVICAGETIPAAEEALESPTRSGKLVLRLALDRIADFYRLP